MKRNSNSESRECRSKVSRRGQGAEGGGGAGVHPALSRTRGGGIAWVQINEVWYIGTFPERDANGFNFVLHELGQAWSASEQCSERG